MGPLPEASLHQVLDSHMLGLADELIEFATLAHAALAEADWKNMIPNLDLIKDCVSLLEDFIQADPNAAKEFDEYNKRVQARRDADDLSIS